MKTRAGYEEKGVKAINSSFLTMSKKLHRFRATCAENRSPLRSVSYRVLDNGETRLHVAYRRKERKPGGREV